MALLPSTREIFFPFVLGSIPKYGEINALLKCFIYTIFKIMMGRCDCCRQAPSPLPQPTVASASASGAFYRGCDLSEAATCGTISSQPSPSGNPWDYSRGILKNSSSADPGFVCHNNYRQRGFVSVTWENNKGAEGVKSALQSPYVHASIAAPPRKKKKKKENWPVFLRAREAKTKSFMKLNQQSEKLFAAGKGLKCMHWNFTGWCSWTIFAMLSLEYMAGPVIVFENESDKWTQTVSFHTPL